MTLLCDGCGADISDTPRPESYIPLADGGGVDLCDDCGAAINALMIGDVENIPHTHVDDLRVVVDPDEYRAVVDSGKEEA